MIEKGMHVYLDGGDHRYTVDGVDAATRMAALSNEKGKGVGGGYSFNRLTPEGASQLPGLVEQPTPFLPACPEEQFGNEATVVPLLIASDVLQKQIGKAMRSLTRPDGDQYDWFCSFADWRVRWLYRNDERWRKVILGRTEEDPRDFLSAWIGHWADAFLLEGPDSFMTKMRKASVGISPDSEWRPHGLLT